MEKNNEEETDVEKLAEHLKNLETKFQQKFSLDNNLILNSTEKPKNSVNTIAKKNADNNKKKIPQQSSSLPKKAKVDQLIRKLDEEYYKQIKETDNITKNKSKLIEELASYKQKVNDIKHVNRDEELLRMQKENQEIEAQLNLLKKRDNTELEEKKESCRKLVEQLNALFNERQRDAAEKEKERERAIEQIKAIKKEQEDHRFEIQKLEADKKKLTSILEKLEKDVESYKIYKTFIDQVNAKRASENKNSTQNDLYDELKEKFEQLMERESEIRKNIEESEKEKEKIKKEIIELRRKNDKQAQNARLQELESEIKTYADMNKQLESEIDTILKEKQKKDSDTHQIKLSIFNLYDKVTENEDGKGKANDFDMDADETKLCFKLDKINEKILDLIKIHKALEKIN